MRPAGPLTVDEAAAVGLATALMDDGFDIALSANRSMAFMNPVGYMIGGAALALLGGLLGGYALALPRNPKQPPAVTPSPTQTSDPTELR